MHQSRLEREKAAAAEAVLLQKIEVALAAKRRPPPQVAAPGQVWLPLGIALRRKKKKESLINYTLLLYSSIHEIKLGS